MKAIRLFGLATGLIIVAGVGYLGYFFNAVAPMASGFAAHALCSNLFIAKRQFEDIEKLDLPAVQQLLTRSVVDGHAVTTGKRLQHRIFAVGRPLPQVKLLF